MGKGQPSLNSALDNCVGRVPVHAYLKAVSCGEVLNGTSSRLGVAFRLFMLPSFNYCVVYKSVSPILSLSSLIYLTTCIYLYHLSIYLAYLSIYLSSTNHLSFLSSLLKGRCRGAVGVRHFEANHFRER